MATEKAAFAGVDLDAPLDAIDDLPEFKTFPSGSFMVTLRNGIVEKVINNHPAMECEMTLDGVLELTEPLMTGENPPAVGDTCTTAFMLDNAVGAGKLKEFLKPIQERLNAPSTRAACAGCKGMQLVIVNKRVHDKDKDRYYANVKKVAVV